MKTVLTLFWWSCEYNFCLTIRIIKLIWLLMLWHIQSYFFKFWLSRIKQAIKLPKVFTHLSCGNKVAWCLERTLPKQAVTPGAAEPSNAGEPNNTRWFVICFRFQYTPGSNFLLPSGHAGFRGLLLLTALVVPIHTYIHTITSHLVIPSVITFPASTPTHTSIRPRREPQSWWEKKRKLRCCFCFYRLLFILALHLALLLAGRPSNNDRPWRSKASVRQLAKLPTFRL